MSEPGVDARLKGLSRMVGNTPLLVIEFIDECEFLDCDRRQAPPELS